MRINIIPYLATAILSGLVAAAPEGRNGGSTSAKRDATLNNKAWVDQTYGKAQKGDICGDTGGLVNLSKDKVAAQAPDCMAMLNAVNAASQNVFIAENVRWSAATADGWFPVMTRGTCTLGVRPSKYVAARYAYFVGYQDVADILHSLINQYQVKIGNTYRFGAQGSMPCKDKIKNEPDYTMEFKFYDPIAK